MTENPLRLQLENRILQTDKPIILLEAGTGVGKTLLALKKLDSLYKHFFKILIVIPRNVLIENWKKEFQKWGYNYMLPNVTFSTYISLHKHSGSWNMVIFDEAHHLSERCREALSAFHISYAIYLSATFKREIKEFLYAFHRYSNIEYIHLSTRKAIAGDLLPDPEIELFPLSLDNRKPYLLFPKKKTKKGERPLCIPYADKWKYRNYKKPLSYICTEQQYYNELSSLIEWYKRKNYLPAMRNLWLHKCGERLHFLSMLKLPYTLKIIRHLPSRFIVFCNTIEESLKLHIPAVNSKIGMENLEKFNKSLLRSLAAVNCLNEGINLTDCQTGVFNAVNASDIMQIQKSGRLLRHTHPILIIPFYIHTREEEIVHKWFNEYPENLIHQNNQFLHDINYHFFKQL